MNNATDLRKGIEKDLASGCQLINVGRFSHRIPIAPQRCPQIICHDEKDIFPLWKQTQSQITLSLHALKSATERYGTVSRKESH